MSDTRDIIFEDFPRFQHEPYIERADIPKSTSNPRTKTFKLWNTKFKELNDYLVRSYNASSKSRNRKMQIAKVHKELLEAKAYTDVRDIKRYTNTDYCVSYDKAFLLEEAGVSRASKKYQVIYKTDELLAEMLAACVGSNVRSLKKRLEENLSQNNRNYKEYCNKMIGKESDNAYSYEFVRYLFNTSSFLDSFFIDLKEKIMRKNYFYHGERWCRYCEEDYEEVFNKAIMCNVMDIQQYIIDNMITDILDFYDENKDDMGGVTSIGRGGFVIQSNKSADELDFPKFRLKGIHGEDICEIKPKIYNGFQFIDEYINTIN
jgi:hypothetical protein